MKHLGFVEKKNLRKGRGIFIMTSENILASGNILLKLLMGPLETTELLIFLYVVAEQLLVQ